MTINEIRRLQEEFGKYSLEEAKRDSLAAIAKYRIPRTMKGYPHITILKNDPVPTCHYCGGTGTYYHPQPDDCLCRTFQREPLPNEINLEFNHQEL